MKSSLICFFLLAWSLCGCSFLGFHSDPYGLNDNEEVEESTDEEEIAEVEDEEDLDLDDEGEGDEEEDVAEDSKPGFFSRLFSFSDDEEGEGEEGDEESGEGEEEEGDFADMESYDDEESTDGMASADMESYEDDSESDQEGMDRDSYYSQSDSPATPTPTRLVSVKKIKDTPYRRAGFLVNAVYLARSGDTIQSVSQKIYGEDRKKALYSINPHFRARTLKIGDKVYYSSPRRPNDSSRLLVYYEDMGQSPSYYSLKEGQNIRVVARKLLGSAESWKELWAVNSDIQSKGAAEKSVDLRYWSGSDIPSQARAEEPVPDEPKMPEEPSEETVPPPVDESSPPVEEPFSESPPPEENFGDPNPGDMPEESKVGIIDAIKKNKLIALGFIAFIALLMFSIKKIINRVRNPEEEFDYTKTSIDQDKISI